MKMPDPPYTEREQALVDIVTHERNRIALMEQKQNNPKRHERADKRHAKWRS